MAPAPRAPAAIDVIFMTSPQIVDSYVSSVVQNSVEWIGGDVGHIRIDLDGYSSLCENYRRSRAATMILVK
jgi:hypothetical protein